MMIDHLDRQLVAATQAGLPLVPDPYDAVARAIDLTRDEVMGRLQQLLAARAIRRIGAIPNHYALGITANGMSVWDVADDVVAEIGSSIGALDFVSHCYERPRHPPLWPHNLFAMVHGRSREEVLEKAATIAAIAGPAARAHDILFSTRMLKKTGLRISA
jgi:DNA-binding Lrp family transcriptional regulator